jgi:hypothetical protein
MYEIWSVGHKPFENFSNIDVCPISIHHTAISISLPPGCPRALYDIMMSSW